MVRDNPNLTIPPLEDEKTDVKKNPEPELPAFLRKRKEGKGEPGRSGGAKKAELVDHPNHYGGDTTYETVKVLEAWMTPEKFIGGLRFNSVKYLSRAGEKPGEPALRDLKKALWYLKKEIEFREKQGEQE